MVGVNQHVDANAVSFLSRVSEPCKPSSLAVRNSGCPVIMATGLNPEPNQEIARRAVIVGGTAAFHVVPEAEVISASGLFFFELLMEDM